MTRLDWLAVCLMLVGLCAVSLRADTHGYAPEQLLRHADVPAGSVGPDGWHLTPHVAAGSAGVRGVRLENGAVRFDQWTYASRLQSPHGIIPAGAFEPGGRLTVDVKLRVDAGRLYLRVHNGVRMYQVLFTGEQIAFSKMHPSEAVTVRTPMSGQPRVVRLQFAGRRAAILVDGRELTRIDDIGLGADSAFSGLQWLALDQQQLPDAWLYAVSVNGSEPEATAPRPPAAPLAVTGAWPAREVELDGAHVTVGPIRVITRQARSPMLAAKGDRIVITSNRTIISEDRGHSWRLHAVKFNHLNTLFLHDGRVLAMRYDPKPVPGRDGEYQADRWISRDGDEPFEPVDPAVVHLPADRFDPRRAHWFHSGLVQLPGGDLLSVMQGQEVVDAPDVVVPWRLFLVRSSDEGKTWRYVSMLADHASLAPIRPTLEADGWRVYGGVEPTLLAIDEQTLLCVSRTVDDESYLDQRVLGEPRPTYHDLSYTVSGDEIHPDVARLPADQYFEPGPPSAPLILMRSDDGGRTWSPPRVMEHARGCFPRLAHQDGVTVLTFGGLAIPRWGNAACFSFDEGRTWTQPVVFAPFLTTGYTVVTPTGPGRFTAFFDSTPPQAWHDVRSFWVGAVDLTIEQRRAE